MCVAQTLHNTSAALVLEACMGRYQRGHIFEQHKAFHVRYYTTERVDGQPKRVQESECLCSKNNRHHSITWKPVRTLAAEVMERINAIAGAQQDKDTKTNFGETVYPPHVRNTKASTVHGYKKIWESHPLGLTFATATRIIPHDS